MKTTTVPFTLRISRWVKPTTKQTCSIPFCANPASKELFEVQESTQKRFKPLQPFYACKHHLEIYLGKELVLINRFGIIVEQLVN